MSGTAHPIVSTMLRDFKKQQRKSMLKRLGFKKAIAKQEKCVDQTIDMLAGRLKLAGQKQSRKSGA